MSRYSKLIAALLGNTLGAIVAVIVGFLASKGIGSCEIRPDLGQVCTIAGHTQAEITAWLMALIMGYVNAQAVYSFPPNTKMVSTKK